MSYTLRNKNYINRPARYCDSDWVTEFPRPQNPILYWQWIGKLRENGEPLGHQSVEESDDDNGSVCFRVPHEYNEGECSDNCPHKPGNEKDEEEQESWVCSECCGYFHATQAEYNEYPCCQECLDKLE